MAKYKDMTVMDVLSWIRICVCFQEFRSSLPWLTGAQWRAWRWLVEYTV